MSHILDLADVDENEGDVDLQNIPASSSTGNNAGQCSYVSVCVYICMYGYVCIGVAVSAFHGVQIRVSFSGSGQQYQMQQLSGGQKVYTCVCKNICMYVCMYVSIHVCVCMYA